MCLISGLATTVTVGTVLADVFLTLAAVGAVSGGAMGIVSGVQQAQNAQAQADYQSKVAEQNARMAQREAEAIELQGNQDRAQLRLKAMDSLSSGRAGYAGNGVVLGQGTAADYEADVLDAYDLDRRNLDYDIASRAWQKQVGAYNSQTQSELYSAQASVYGQQATTSLIGGVFNTVGDTANVGAGAANMLLKMGK